MDTVARRRPGSHWIHPMSTPDPDTLLAETRAFNVELERMLATMPAGSTPCRRTRAVGSARRPRASFPRPCTCRRRAMIEIDGPGGPIPLRIIAPEGKPTGTFLHLHGGGWTLGESDGQDVRLQRLARETGLTVVSVNYRLAPENPYPAGPDDCEAAALWLLGEEGQAELAPRGRARSAAIRRAGSCRRDPAAAARPARDHRRVRRRRAPVRLLRPVDDAEPAAVGRAQPDPLGADHRCGSATSSSPRTTARRAGIRTSRRCSRTCRACPRRSSRSGPRIRCSTTRCSWRRAGARPATPRELRIWPEAPHGFVSLPMSVADVALGVEHDFLRRTLRVAPN